MTAIYLERALRQAGIPIIGVSIGREDDRQSWRVDFAPGVTDTHRAQASALIVEFTPPTADDVATEVAQAETTRKELKAMALGLWECIPNPTMTRAQLAARIVALYKGL